jgi:hypothetical protein
MDAAELHAKAIIAAALIASHIVSIPTLPAKDTQRRPDQAAIHLRALTDYVYTALTGPVEL